MDAKAATASLDRAAFPRGLLGPLDSDVAEKMAAAAGDVAMVIDRDGVIRDLALSSDTLAREGAHAWIDRPWLDIVTIESKPKVDALLRDAGKGGHMRWREINQILGANTSLMVRFVALSSGRDGQVIAIGRDERATAALQQRLMEAQQALERDYSKLREAEGRYRLLFRLSGEAVWSTPRRGASWRRTPPPNASWARAARSWWAQGSPACSTRTARTRRAR